MLIYDMDDLGALGYGHCGIYLITNILTQKKYVGQSTDILARWLQHEEAQASTELYEDMRRYGLERFNFRILEECSPRVLDEHEYFWIKTLDTYENGYNNTQGNIGVINHLLSVGEYLDEPEPKVVENVLWELKYDERYPFLDFDYIHGTDDPEEIDSLWSEIMGPR